MDSRIYLRISLAASALALAAMAPGAATIQMTRVEGDGFTPGTRLRLLVAITANTSGQTPQGVAFRISYPNDLTFGYDPPGPPGVITVEPAELGSVFAAPLADVLSPSTLGRDIATLGANTSPTPLTPLCFYVNFTPTSGLTLPYTIGIQADPDSTAPVSYFQVSPPMFGAISPLTFNGVTISAPDVAASPTSVSFTPVTVGFDSTAGVAIENVAGGQELSVFSIAIVDNGDPAGTFTIDSPPTTPLDIPPSSALPLVLRFTPPTDGVFNSAVLEVTSNSPGEETIQIPLSGVGLPISREKDWMLLED